MKTRMEYLKEAFRALGKVIKKPLECGSCHNPVEHSYDVRSVTGEKMRVCHPCLGRLSARGKLQDAENLYGRYVREINLMTARRLWGKVESLM